MFISNTFLTGNAGTGKTTLINKFIADNPGKVIVLAPTGVAAVNCGGMTIHKFFKFPARPISYSAVKRLVPNMPEDAEKLAILKAAEYIIIDEISMVRADIMDQIGWFFHKNYPGEVLGGKIFIMVGDLSQLPPVIASDGERDMIAQRYRSEFFFDALLWANVAKFETVTLTKIWRQTDPLFITFLNSIKTGTITAAALGEFNRTQWLPGRAFSPEDGIMLCTTNAIADAVNAQMLASHPGKMYASTGELKGNFDPKNSNIDVILRLKIGVRVMTMRNDPAGEYQNGTIGTVERIDMEGVTLRLENGQSVTVGRHTFDEIEYSYDKKTDKISHKTKGQFIQFPLRIAYAITIHKSQGKTFDKIIIDLGERGAFAHGQLYVALSRCRTMEGIILRRPIQMKDLIYNSHVTEFNNYERT